MVMETFYKKLVKSTFKYCLPNWEVLFFHSRHSEYNTMNTLSLVIPYEHFVMKFGTNLWVDEVLCAWYCDSQCIVMGNKEHETCSKIPVCVGLCLLYLIMIAYKLYRPRIVC